MSHKGGGNFRCEITPIPYLKGDFYNENVLHPLPMIWTALLSGQFCYGFTELFS